MTSPGGDLWVEPTHLQDLADKQHDAAAQIASAAMLTAGEAEAVERTHGSICAPAATAAQAAETARAKACAAVQSMSDAFAVNLERAAARYSRTDQSEGHKIDDTMRPGFR